MEWYHTRWPWLTAKLVARFVSDNWVSCLIILATCRWMWFNCGVCNSSRNGMALKMALKMSCTRPPNSMQPTETRKIWPTPSRPNPTQPMDGPTRVYAWLLVRDFCLPFPSPNQQFQSTEGMTTVSSILYSQNNAISTTYHNELD